MEEFQAGHLAPAFAGLLLICLGVVLCYASSIKRNRSSLNVVLARLAPNFRHADV